MSESPKFSSAEESSPSIYRGAIAYMASNPVAANLLMMLMLVGGFLMSTQVTREVFPSFELNIVTVSVANSGATPTEMEQSVVLAIEDAVESVDGVKEINATMASGVATVTIEAEESVDPNVFLQDIKAEVDRISTFPQEAEDPVITLASTRRQVVSLLLSGSSDLHVLRYWADVAHDELTQSKDIAQVTLSGVRDYEIHVEISQDTLRRYGLTLNDVANAIKAASLEQGGGTLRTVGGDIMVQLNERRDTAQDFANIAVRTLADGSRIMLDDIATVSEGFDNSKRWAEFNNQPAVMLQVYSSPDVSPDVAAAAAQKVVERLNSAMPNGLTLSVRNSFADMYEQRQDLLVSNAMQGIVLVFLSLALFLRPSLAFWVSLGIPVSILGSMWFFQAFDQSINVISMFAFIVTLGIVVDDAIVVGENICSWQARKFGAQEASVRGTKEVGIPVVFSVLTNMLTFLPMMFIPGMMGKVWAVLPFVIIAVFSCSLVESLFILPAHVAMSQRHEQKTPFALRKKTWWRPLAVAVRQQQERFSVGFLHFVEFRFGALLRLALRHRYIVLAGGVALFMITVAYVASGRLGFDLMPRTESDYAYAEAVLPSGSARGEIERIKEELLAPARALVEKHGGEALSKGIYVNVSDTKLTVRVYFVPPDLRPVSTEQFTREWRAAVGEIAGIENLQMLSDKGGPGSGKAITVRLSHRDSATLDAAAVQLGVLLSHYDGVGDIDTGTSRTTRQFDIKLLPLAEQLGFTSASVIAQVRAAFEGAIALRQQRGNNEVTVRVRLPEEERNRVAGFEDLILRSPSGQEVLLRDIVRVEDSNADSVMYHVNGKRTASVSASVTPSSATGRMMETVTKDIMPNLVAQYPGLSWEFGGRQVDMRDSTQTMIWGFVFAMLGVYALLAIPFKNYIQPLIIMVAIPFGFIGAVFGHVIMGYSLSVISFFGIVALSGVVVNDSLVLIDFANRKVRGGSTHESAVYSAAIQRFRPIILTTLTTFVGLVPIIFETSRQARMMIPVALSLGFGILFSTIICLVLVPSLYLAVEDCCMMLRKV